MGPGRDQVDAESILWLLLEAGLIVVFEKQDRKGDWSAQEWMVTSRGARLAASDDRPQAEIGDFLGGVDPPHPVLESIRHWLAHADPRRMSTHIVIAVGEELRAGRVPRGRVLSMRIAGDTKAVKIGPYRSELEAAFGFPLEHVVRLHGQGVMAFGAFQFEVRGYSIDGRWSRPCLTLTPETLAEVRAIKTQARRLLTIENLTSLEHEVLTGIPDDTIAVFTGGFPHSLERKFFAMALEAGVTVVDHWGDIDVGGLRILRHMMQIIRVPVRPFRMTTEALEKSPTRPLTVRDRDALKQWVNDPEAPLRDLASEMLSLNKKAEQEGWILFAE